MKRKLTISITLFCVVIALLPYTISAQEVGVLEETSVPEIEETITKTTRAAINYPATIASIFPDANLAQVVATTLGKQVTDTITKVDLEGITTLDAKKKGVINLTGLDECSNLTTLDLSSNTSNGNPLSDLRTVDWNKLNLLVELNLGFNRIWNVPATFSGLTSLKKLDLRNNSLTKLNTVNWDALTSLESVELGSQTSSLSASTSVGSSLYTLNQYPILDTQGTPITITDITNDEWIYDSTWTIPSDVETEGFTYRWSATQTINGLPVNFSGTWFIGITRSYQTTFKDWDGTIINQWDNYYKDEEIFVPENPTRPGYIFKEWTPTVEVEQPARNIEYTATYTLISPPTTPNPTLNPGRTCQDDGYPKEYEWDGKQCAIPNGYKAPNTGVR